MSMRVAVAVTGACGSVDTRLPQTAARPSDRAALMRNLRRSTSCMVTFRLFTVAETRMRCGVSAGSTFLRRDNRTEDVYARIRGQVTHPYHRHRSLIVAPGTT